MDVNRLFFIDNSVDRRGEVRLEEGALTELRSAANARFLFIRRGRVKARLQPNPGIAWLSAHERANLDTEILATAFLGAYDGCPCFALIPLEVPPTANDRALATTDEADFVGLRRAAMLMPAAEAALAGHAVHLSNWLNRNRYCGSCGAAMQVLEGGHKLACSATGCAREEFPRTDPVVITLVTHGEHCLLARQPSFPPRFYSALAGFVEPGETLEAAVQREVREEVKLTVERLRYIGSQPWPFPTSLMVGYLAEATGTDFEVDRRELEQARWFERAEVEELARSAPDASRVLLPPTGVMGRQLIDVWLARA